MIRASFLMNEKRILSIIIKNSLLYKLLSLGLKLIPEKLEIRLNFLI